MNKIAQAQKLIKKLNKLVDNPDLFLSVDVSATTISYKIGGLEESDKTFTRGDSVRFYLEDGTLTSGLVVNVTKKYVSVNHPRGNSKVAASCLIKV